MCHSEQSSPITDRGKCCPTRRPAASCRRVPPRIFVHPATKQQTSKSSPTLESRGHVRSSPVTGPAEVPRLIGARATAPSAGNPIYVSHVGQSEPQPRCPAARPPRATSTCLLRLEARGRSGRHWQVGRATGGADRGSSIGLTKLEGDRSAPDGAGCVDGGAGLVEVRKYR
jgi:hypothetical protein